LHSLSPEEEPQKKKKGKGCAIKKRGMHSLKKRKKQMQRRHIRLEINSAKKVLQADLINSQNIKIMLSVKYQINKLSRYGLKVWVRPMDVLLQFE